MKKPYFLLRLQRFADGGSEGAASGVTSSQDAAGTSGEETAQAAAAENQEARPTFDELIKGDYKEDYDKAVQKIVRSRFSQAKQNEQRLEKMAPILQALAAKYGTEVDDIDSIAKYIDEDEQLYEDAALRAGLTVEQYKRFTKLEAENQRLQTERQLNEQRQAMNAQVAQWREEEKAIKAEFPGFDLDTYINDPTFSRMVGSGVSLRNAYIAMDVDEILPAAMGHTAQQVAAKTAATIAQRGNRPVEGGMSGQASSKAKVDVSRLSNAEIAEYVRRANSGERIIW